MSREEKWNGWIESGSRERRLVATRFRELEFALGWKEPKALERYPAGSEVRRRLERRLKSRSLWDSFLHHLASNGVPVPRSDLDRDVTCRVQPSPALREALIGVYRSQPALAELCERLLDLDEGLMEWRYRHVKMVQRTIGTRRGTGGSAGADYLLATLNPPLFPDLWAIRTEL